MSSGDSKPADGNLRVPHTPGPWCARKWGWVGSRWPDKRISIGPENGHLALAVVISPKYVNHEQMLADATLIAAAPEMLELLLEGMKGFETHLDFIAWKTWAAMVTDKIAY